MELHGVMQGGLGSQRPPWDVIGAPSPHSYLHVAAMGTHVTHGNSLRTWYKWTVTTPTATIPFRIKWACFKNWAAGGWELAGLHDDQLSLQPNVTEVWVQSS